MPKAQSISEIIQAQDQPNIPLREKKAREIRAELLIEWLQHPEFTDEQMRQFAMRAYARSRRNATEDIAQVKAHLAAVQNASPEWGQYEVTQMLKIAYQVANKKEDPTNMIRAVAQLISIYKLANTQTENPHLDIIPEPFTPSPDPALLGEDAIAIPEETKRALAKRYGVQILGDLAQTPDRNPRETR